MKFWVAEEDNASHVYPNAKVFTNASKKGLLASLCEYKELGNLKRYRWIIWQVDIKPNPEFVTMVFRSRFSFRDIEPVINSKKVVYTVQGKVLTAREIKKMQLSTVTVRGGHVSSVL